MMAMGAVARVLALGISGCFALGSACGPPFIPPEPDRCESAATGGVDLVEVGEADSEPFTPWADEPIVDFVLGGQGTPMLGVRYHLNGPAVPACVVHETRLAQCWQGVTPCAEPTDLAVVSVPIQTYAEPNGSRTTQPLWLVLFGREPAEGESFELAATLAGVTETRTLWRAYRIDAGPGVDAGGILPP
jgi:hypothetical protein